MSNTRNILIVPLLLTVIAISFTFPKWEGIIQASLASFSLGAKFAKFIMEKYPPTEEQT